MNETRTVAPADALIALLQSTLTGDGAQAFGYLVVYTSFGVVKGRTGMAFHEELISQERGGEPPQLIELNDVIVEHYSNHLATATFERFYVRLSEVQAFALVGSKGQS
ncbi:MAG TPA: hypothetical protein VNS63_23910 [Blastocatellia bacterium]|nr:hypothetical protein [Blastocatellia bacterium]